MPQNRHPVTGCRADTIFDLWLHPYQQLESFVNSAWSVVARGDLMAISQKSAEQDELFKNNLYHVNDGIAEITISGPITKHPTSFSSMFGGTSTMRIRQAIRDIRQDSSIKGVFIHADSWGGTAEGTPELVEAIRQLNTVMPVVVHAEDKATSGMLWLAVPGQRFTCGPAACIGSQGTMTQIFDTSKTESGSKPILITTGKYKGIGTPGLPVTPEQITELQRNVDGINEPFKTDVVRHRNLSKPQTDEVATARIFVGKDAKRVGLIDAVCSTDDAMMALRELIKERAAGRGPARIPPNPAAPTRSKAMPLTAEQLIKARQLPGAASITEENADTVLLGSAVELHTKLQSTEQQLGAKTAEIIELRKQVPVKIDESVLAAKAQLMGERLDFAAEKGQLLPTQLAKLKTSLMVDGKANPAMLNDAVQSVVFDVIKENKPNGVVTPVSAAQPAPKVTPGEQVARGDVPTFEQHNKNREHANLPPLTREQYNVKFGQTVSA